MLVLSYYDVEWNGLPEEFMDAAKQAIQDWALDIVGEDETWHNGQKMVNEPDPEHLDPYESWVRNQLRAELRKQIRGSDD